MEVDVCNKRICLLCCRLTFLVAAVVEAAAAVASIVLWRRTAYIYAQEHREIQQEELIVKRHPHTGMRLVRQRHAVVQEQLSRPSSHDIHQESDSPVTH